MTKQSQKKYDRLLEKAIELFLKYGYKKVSVDQIAGEAGISKMTVYKHFPSKEDLYIAAIIKYSDHHLDNVKKQIDECYHTIDKIEALYAYSLEASKEVQPELYKDIFERPYILEKLMAYKRDAVYVIFKDILEDGIKKGEIRNLNIDFVARILMGMQNIFIGDEEFFKEDGLSRIINNLFDFMKYGLLGGLENPKK